MDYKKRPLWQWILLYVIIGGILYAIVYFVFLKGAYSTKSSSSNNPYSSSSKTTPAKSTSDSTTGNQNSGNQASTTNPTDPTPNTSDQTTNPPVTAVSKSFSVNADDTGADMETLSVAKGTAVSLTFNVKTGTTYHGGLEFVGNNIDTGTITPGSSKTVQFTADKSFSFIPYWPANSVKKDYTIDIAVN